MEKNKMNEKTILALIFIIISLLYGIIMLILKNPSFIYGFAISMITLSLYLIYK